MNEIILKGEYTSIVQFEINNNLLKRMIYFVNDWNSKHKYEDRLELNDIFDYVFTFSDLNGNEDYIYEHFEKFNS
jgi:hypothetical protein